MTRRYAECLPLEHFRLISFVSRTQGLMVKPGNPKDIHAVVDLCRRDVRMVNRQRGSGTRALLEFLISAEGLERTRMQGYENEEVTHGAVAALIAGNQADVGIGVQAAAAQYRLGFVPLVEERYYLACRAADIDTKPILTLLDFLRSKHFAMMVRELPGYASDRPGFILDTFETEESTQQ